MRFQIFRRLLGSAKRLLLTAQSLRDDEQIPLSPWLESLRLFQRLAYSEDVIDNRLEHLIKHVYAWPVTEDISMSMPQPVVPEKLIPKSISATTHQHLIDCPYKFFAAHCLKLEAPEEISRALSKADYGARVHDCLRAFHIDVKDLPGPFQKPITTENRQQAIDVLRKITVKIFHKDLEDNFLHRSWQKRWLNIIPDYIDWEIDRMKLWQLCAAEQRVNRELNKDMSLNGRIDRMDQCDGKYAVIDYKTGRLPRESDVENGETVQLPSYALLLDDVERVEYLRLSEPGNVKAVSIIEGERLARLRTSVGERLTNLLQQIRQAQPLPAWGDYQICEYCDMSGICRRQAWDENF